MPGRSLSRTDDALIALITRRHVTYLLGQVTAELKRTRALRDRLRGLSERYGGADGDDWTVMEFAARRSVGAMADHVAEVVVEMRALIDGLLDTLSGLDEADRGVLQGATTP